MNRCCQTGRLVRSPRGGEVRISVEVFVEPHRLVLLTAGRALMILLQELQDDHVPVHHVRVALSGRLPRDGDGR